MDDDIDIYEDLDNFDGKKDENYFSTISKLKSEAIKLEDQTKVLEKQIENLEATNNTLKMNLSSLLKTAKNEIVRKDRIISELRQQLENKTFRRNSYEQFKSNNSNDFNAMSQSKNKVYKVHVKQELIFQTPEFVNSNLINSTTVTSDKLNKNDKNDNYMPTVFGQRLRKKIREEEESAKAENSHSKRLALESNIKKEIKNEEKIDFINLGNKENQFSILSSNNQADQNSSQKSLKRPSETALSSNLDKKTKVNEGHSEDDKNQVKNLLDHNREQNLSNVDISSKSNVVQTSIIKKHESLDSSHNEPKSINGSINKNCDMKTEKKDLSNISKRNINSWTFDNSSELFCEKKTTHPPEKVIIPRRRKAARLTDSSTSMTIVVSENSINQIPNKQ